MKKKVNNVVQDGFESGNAVATIGDATIYGTFTFMDGCLSFVGGRVRLKRPLKNQLETLTRRLRNNKRVSVRSQSGSEWNNEKMRLIGYSFTTRLSALRYGVSSRISCGISFTLSN